MARTQKKIEIENDVAAPVSLLASSILDVSVGMERILNTKLSKRAIVLLLQDAIGPSRINRNQIEWVLDNLPLLKDIYLKKDKS